MSWVGHVAQRGERESAYRVLVGKLKRERPLGRPRCIYGRIIVRWIFSKWDSGDGPD